METDGRFDTASAASLMQRQYRTIGSRTISYFDTTAGTSAPGPGPDRTLVIVGSEDTLTPPSVGRDLQRGIPGARFVVVDSAGHLSSLEQPERFTAAVTAFLGALPDDD